MGIPVNRKTVLIAVAVVLLVGALLVLQPVTRNLAAQDDVCGYCHVDYEYRADVRLAYSKHHPLPATEGYEDKQAHCVDCHLPTGPIDTLFAYTHFASLTDLFGHFRYRTAERAGSWLPPRQAAAYRVRDRLFEYDSPTCRLCHIEEEIEPKRERGKNAHKKALEDKQTCIECHYNETHRAVDVREGIFKQQEQEEASTAPAKEKPVS
ncbi:MAG: NapC/NirT family cytochrome c [Gammaproteobacteria bacterium]|nr:NapC/NirT family cytochrome c [Gammaproteobacteria bacterium]MDH3872405.1 NapC/NirT family cytochrome c [Gammaproteobacteria bacterium]